MMNDIPRRWQKKIDRCIDDDAIFYITASEFG